MGDVEEANGTALGPTTFAASAPAFSTFTTATLSAFAAAPFTFAAAPFTFTTAFTLTFTTAFTLTLTFTGIHRNVRNS